MQNHIIIIEGNDNSGKDTLIKGIKKNIHHRVSEYHCEAPKSKDPEEAAKEQRNFFNTLICKSIYDKRQIVIYNRGWQGEYVYGTLYRGRSKEDVLEDIEVFDNTLMTFTAKISYIQLIAEPEVLKNNEDGLSISQGKLEKIQQEKELFEEIYEKSILPKIKINVTENGNYISKDAILDIAMNFINRDIIC